MCILRQPLRVGKYFHCTFWYFPGIFQVLIIVLFPQASENRGLLLSRSGGDDEQRRELCEDEKHRLRTENEQLQKKVCSIILI